MKPTTRVLEQEFGDNVTTSPRKPQKLERRSQLEIRMDILKAVRESEGGPTRIMYKANLAWVTLQDHLRALSALGLIRETEAEGSRKSYLLTKKGMDVIQAYLELRGELYEGQAEAPREQVAF